MGVLSHLVLRLRPIVLGVTLAALSPLSMPSTAVAASSLTIDSPGHGTANQTFVATYTLPTAGRCSTPYVSFSWDSTGPGNGDVLATKACSSPTVAATLTPPAGSVVGGHTVYGYFSSISGTDASIDAAAGRYTVDPTPAPTPLKNQPPTATTLGATNITDHSATINGTVNPHGCTGSGGLSWSFPFGLTTNYGMSGGPTGGVSPSSTVDIPISGSRSGLDPNTTYHFQLSVFGPCGGGNGQDLSFTTLAATSQDLTVTTLAASKITAYSVTLNGTLNPHGCSAPGGGLSWSFPFGLTSNYGMAGGPTGGVSPSSSVDIQVFGSRSGLTPKTTYHFQLSAFGPCGGGNGQDMSFTTLAATIPDITATTLAATNITDQSATLNGKVNPHGCTAPGNGVSWSFPIGLTTNYGMSGGQTGGVSATSSIDISVSGKISGLSPNTTYHFQLSVFGPCGGGSGKDLTFTTGGGAVPLMLIIGGLGGLGLLGFVGFKLGWLAKLGG